MQNVGTDQDTEAVTATLAVLDAVAQLIKAAQASAQQLHTAAHAERYVAPLPVAYGNVALFARNGMSEYAFRLWCSASNYALSEHEHNLGVTGKVTTLRAHTGCGVEVAFHRDFEHATALRIVPNESPDGSRDEAGAA